MKALLIEIDDATAAKLETIAPARSRRRSQFVRDAIRRAIWAIEEQATREAYLRQPQDEAAVDPAAWDPAPSTARRSSPPAKRKRART